MTQIKLKHSVVKDKKPTAADLPDFGEVALNAHVDSPGLYTKGSDGSIITLVGSNTSSGDNPMDGRYVQKAGDDMTGNLTLGTDKITLGVDGSAEFASGGITFDNAGSAEFKGDVAIGDSTTFRGSIGDAVALLPNGIVEQFKTIIDDLPKAQPYGATTLPAELPTPLRDALERATTAGKINLNSDGSADFLGTVRARSNLTMVLQRQYNLINPAEFRIGCSNDTSVSNSSGTKVYQHIIKESGDSSGHNLDFIQKRRGEADRQVFQLKADGSADFAGTVVVGNWDNTGGSGVGSNVGYAGGIYCRRSSSANNTDTLFGGWKATDKKFEVNALGSLYLGSSLGTSGDGASISLNNDGSATFAGAVQCAGNPVSGGEVGTRLTAGMVQATRENDSDAIYVGYQLGNANTTFRVTANGNATFAGDITAGNVTFNLETDNPDNYTTTTEEYTETEYYTVEVPVVERPGVGTVDIQDGVSTADLVDGDERETQTITKSREVTKTREVKTYTGPTMEVKEELLALRERAAQQDAIIAQMTEALKKLGADIDPPAKTKTAKKK